MLPLLEKNNNVLDIFSAAVAYTIYYYVYYYAACPFCQRTLYASDDAQPIYSIQPLVCGLSAVAAQTATTEHLKQDELMLAATPNL